MDTLFVSVFILFAAATELIMLRPAGAFRDEAADEKMFKRASLSDSISVHARGRGNPYISLSDGRDVITAYDGPPDLVEAMEQNRANPLSLASADFDEDGVPDLVSGYGGPDGGIITVQRGNIDSIHPNTLEAKRRRAEGDFTESPFLSPARTFYVPETAEFIVAGDFDADGHFDVAVASRGSKGLVLLPGDGRAGFGEARKIDLPGAVTALTSGDINRRDGLIDIVVAVAADDGPEALIFEGPRGASNAKPEIILLPDAATSLAIGQLDGEYPIDIAVAAGSGLVIRHGRDRRLSLDEVRQGGVSGPVTRQMSFGFKINSIAVGNFTGRHESSLAMLSSDGTVYLANLNKEVKTHALASVPWLGDAELVCSNVSSGPADDLAVLDRSGKRVHILSSSGPGMGAGNGGSTALPRTVASLDLAGAPLAALPMRLNSDALDDLVTLQAGRAEPTLINTSAAGTFTVNKTDDHDDGVCDSGDCTLREAIKAANANPGADTVAFSIPGPGVHTITPGSALPTVTDPVAIDGTTQPGFAGMPVIEVSGSGMNTDGLAFTAGDSTVRGLVINDFSDSGIQVESDNNVIEGNFIGTDPTGTLPGPGSSSGIILISASNNLIGGTTAAARNVVGNNSEGILILSVLPFSSGNTVQGNHIGIDVTGAMVLFNSSGASVGGENNTVGGTTAGARNLISGNSHEGVGISGPGSLLQGNFIGTDVSGTTGLANLSSGVEVGLQVLVGGTTPAARNIISGNEEFGVKVGGFQAMVQGNFIGTDVTGTKALGNFIGGVAVNSGINNVIGGAAQGAGNLISGNRGAGGIDLRGENNLVQGNLIGTDVTGAETLGNMGSGVAVRASGNQIGGTAPGTCNVISANQIGVQIGGGISTGPDRAVVQGNFIGTDISGAVALPNTIHGIVIVDSRDNLIGGDEAGAGNTIAFNENIGIAVFSSTSLRNSIRGNSIFSNGDLGIDMLPSNLIGVIVGVTPNDPCDVDSGQNNLQNFPVLGPASSSGNVTTVQGTLNSKPNTPHTIEFFANDTCDPSGFGEGQTFIGSTTVTTGNDCNGGFIVNLPVALSSDRVITAKATDPSGNTSEFSPCIPVNTGACSFSIMPENQSFAAGGGQASVVVTADPGCNWTAVSNDPWITITSGSSGTGPGTVSYTVAASTNPARTGMLFIAGRTFTVSQAAGCTFSLDLSFQSFDAMGGIGAFTVINFSGCAWTATANVDWITITSGENGSGVGTVLYSVDANPDPTHRSGTIRAAGRNFIVLQGALFADVPPDHPFFNEIGRLSARGVTLGCNATSYCPDDVVTRQQMAAFIIRALGDFDPPPPAQQRFLDVLPSNPFYAFIDQMAIRQITLGCGGGNYCPTDPVLRDQMAAFIIRALHAPGYIPPQPASQRFPDVPPSNLFYAHIEEMAVRQITLGCGGGNYCPSLAVTRGQMAAFLVRAFNL